MAGFIIFQLIGEHGLFANKIRMLRMIESIYGIEAFRNVIIVSTNWENLRSRINKSVTSNKVQKRKNDKRL